MNGYYRTFAVVDLDAIRKNILAARERISRGVNGKDVKLLAVIKADGYGHGATCLAHYLQDLVDFFGVATIDEAVEIRESFRQSQSTPMTVRTPEGEKSLPVRDGNTPILILGYTSPKEYEVAVREEIRLTMDNEENLKAFAAEAVRQGRKAYAHIKLNTGMTRLGFEATPEEAKRLAQLVKTPGLVLEGLFTHFSCADMTDEAFTHEQEAKYKAFAEALEAEGLSIPIKHACNSAGIMRFSDSYYDMCRSGIITYGLYPSDEVDHSLLQLAPAMSWFSHVIHVREIEAGVPVSYGATFVSERPMRLATVCVGYADGYSRSLSSRGFVLIHGQKAPIVGRVCMDQMMVDVTDIENVCVEDVVTLAGCESVLTGKAAPALSVDEISALAGSFSYEFVCGIGKRVPRLYVGEKLQGK